MRRVIIIEDDGAETSNYWAAVYWDGDPCKNCSNNPLNNPSASGICNCVLPEIYRQGGYRPYRSVFTSPLTTWTTSTTAENNLKHNQ